MTSPNTKVESITMQRRTKPHDPSNLMTIREYFAGLAMQALITNQNTSKWLPEDLATTATTHADALIEQLNK